MDKKFEPRGFDRILRHLLWLWAPILGVGGALYEFVVWGKELAVLIIILGLWCAGYSLYRFLADK